MHIARANNNSFDACNKIHIAKVTLHEARWMDFYVAALLSNIWIKWKWHIKRKLTSRWQYFFFFLVFFCWSFSATQRIWILCTHLFVALHLLLSIDSPATAKHLMIWSDFFFPFGDISQICVCVHVMYSNGWICVLFFVFRWIEIQLCMESRGDLYTSRESIKENVARN